MLPPEYVEYTLGRRRFVRQLGALGAMGGLAAAGLGPDLMAADEPATSSDSSWQIGCFTRPFSEFTYSETLDAIAAAGFASVGLMAVKLPSGTVTLADANEAQLGAIRDEAAKRKLAISVTYYGGPPVKNSLSEGIDGIRKLIGNCQQTGCAAIVLGGTADESIMTAYYEAIAAVCDEAAEKKVTLVLKPHGGLNATGPQCREIIRKVDHPAFRLWYDPGNILYYSEGAIDPLDDVESVAGLVTGMCVKDFMPPRDVAVNPGTGRVKFPELMKRLKAGGFRSGPLVVETLAPGDLATTTANARAAREFLEKLVS